MPSFSNAPKAMNSMMEKIYAKCMKTGYKDEERCSKVAVAAAKKKYKKVGRKWIRKNV